MRSTALRALVSSKYQHPDHAATACHQPVLSLESGREAESFGKPRPSTARWILALARGRVMTTV